MDPDSDPGGPKTCGSGGSGSGSATLGERKVTEIEHFVDFFVGIGHLMCLSEKLPDEPLLSEARGSKVAQGGVAQ